METVTISQLIDILKKIKDSDGDLPVYAYTEGMSPDGLFGGARVVEEENDPYLDNLPKRVILT